MTIGLVGQDQITTFTSPVNGTSPIDANTVRGNDNTVKTAFNVHDKDPTIHFQSSLAAARPPAGVPGRKWLDTDTRRVYYDDGVTWNEIAYLAAGGGGGTAIPGPVVIAGGGITTDGGITAAGDITAGGNVIAHTLFIAEGTAAQNRGTVARTAGVTRWFVGANAAAETGGNAGSDLSIAAYSDAGALLRESFVVKRDTGAMTLTAPSVTASGLVTANGGILNTGSTIARFQGSYGARPAGSAGIGVEIGYDGGTGTSAIQSFDATGAALAALTLKASAVVIGTDPGGTALLRVGGDCRIANAAPLNIFLNTTTGAATDAVQVIFQRAGINKWRLGTAIDGTTDALQIYNDSGVIAVSIAKATSVVTFAAAVTMNSGLAAPLCVAGTSGAGMVRIGVGVENGYVTGAGFEFTYSTAALAASLTVYDRGALALRKLELQASAYAFIGLGGGSGILSVGAADSGGAGFRTVRVPN